MLILVALIVTKTNGYLININPKSNKLNKGAEKYFNSKRNSLFLHTINLD